MSDPGDFLDVLNARRGVVCLVGAGGKKTAMYRMAAMNPGRTGISATVRIPPFPKELDASVVVREAAGLASAVVAEARENDVAFAHPLDKSRRLGGVDPALLAGIHARAGFDATYVKADGARFRWIKAPDHREPQILAESATVIPVVSARAIGQPLSDRVAHHPGRLAELLGLEPGGVICPEHLGLLLGSELGALHRIPDRARVVPLINMVDDSERFELAREAAKIALAQSTRFTRVVLASLRREMPLIDVVER